MLYQTLMLAQVAARGTDWIGYGIAGLIVGVILTLVLQKIYRRS